MNYFEVLNGINVNANVEKKKVKNNKTGQTKELTYLSWSWAWGELKKRHPLASYSVYERPDGVNYFTDGRTCWVKVGVTVPVTTAKAEDGKVIETDTTSLEHVEMLPVMDFKNESLPLDKITSYDVNKAIQRALTKAIARHGLGLYIYAGEDLPEEPPKPAEPQILCGCGRPIKAAGGYTSEQLAQARFAKYGEPLCDLCAAVKRQQMAEKEKAIETAFEEMKPAEEQTNE